MTTEHPDHRTRSVKTARVLIPILFIAAGVLAFVVFKASAPAIVRTPPKREIPRVRTMTVQSGDVTVTISAMGTVIPFRRVTVRSRVSGEVAQVSGAFVPGGRIDRGGLILRLDDTDHLIAVSRAQSARDSARAALSLEEGNQAVAREELRLLADLGTAPAEPSELILRKPQLDQARAALAAAEAELRLAELNLSRTQITAPFNALVLDRQVNLGSYVNAQDSLATLVDADTFWVEAAVPIDDLARFGSTPAEGAPARIRSQTGAAEFPAAVVRTAGNLSGTGRMATVILSVKNPLGDGTHRLFIDDYVSVSIEAGTLTGVCALPRSALQDNDTVLIYENDRLSIRPVTPVFRSGETVYIGEGLNGGESVILSGPAHPVDGMAVEQAGVADMPESEDKR
ncbi:MdtA/MuxA family multidrug efflux RND transporter periplasmic adaptor subunit [Desulfatiferula olefinivorans]